jgi:hypothetical protein
MLFKIEGEMGTGEEEAARIIAMAIVTIEASFLRIEKDQGTKAGNFRNLMV